MSKPIAAILFAALTATPASAFDILGVLSFAQGVITVIIAGILAFRALTEQVGHN